MSKRFIPTIIILALLIYAALQLRGNLNNPTATATATPAPTDPPSYILTITAAFSGVPTSAPGTPTRTPLPTFDPSILTENAQQLPTSTFAPTHTAAPVSTGPTSLPYPNNCDEARAFGYTAQQAAQYNHLDRDNDGVACYGD